MEGPVAADCADDSVDRPTCLVSDPAADGQGGEPEGQACSDRSPARAAIGDDTYESHSPATPIHRRNLGYQRRSRHSGRRPRPPAAGRPGSPVPAAPPARRRMPPATARGPATGPPIVPGAAPADPLGQAGGRHPGSAGCAWWPASRPLRRPLVSWSGHGRYQNSGSHPATGTRAPRRGGREGAPAWGAAWTAATSCAVSVSMMMVQRSGTRQTTCPACGGIGAGLVTPGTVEETVLVRLLDTPEIQRLL